MKQINDRRLLKNRQVVGEIERYRWIESEKCGYDIGFEKAADHWIVYYALAWLKYHAPDSQEFRLTAKVRRSLRQAKN